MPYEKLEYRIYGDSRKEYRNTEGLLHRPNGPAVIYSNGRKAYWLNDRPYTEQDWTAKTQRKEMTITEIEAALGHGVKVVK